MAALEAEAAKRLADDERLEQRLNEWRSLQAEKAEDTPRADSPLSLVAERRLEALQEALNLEAAAREVSGREVAQQLFDLTEALERQAGLAAAAADLRWSSNEEGELVDDWRQELTVEKGERTKEMNSMSHQMKDLRLCLEAEVGARSAATERLHREVHDLRIGIDSKIVDHTSKASKDSLQDVGQSLQVQLQELEESILDTKKFREELLSRKEVDDKIQMLIDRQGQERGASCLEVEVLREGLKGLEAQAKKFGAWVEAQAEKNAARQDAIETTIKGFQLDVGQEAKARTALDEELRQYLVDELSAQAKFFEGELKGLLASAHTSWIDEIKKIWNALQMHPPESLPASGGSEAAHSSRESREVFSSRGASGKKDTSPNLGPSDRAEPKARTPCRDPSHSPPRGMGISANAPPGGERTRLTSETIQRVKEPAEAAAQGTQAVPVGRSTPVTNFKSMQSLQPPAHQRVSATATPGRSSPSGISLGSPRAQSPRPVHPGGLAPAPGARSGPAGHPHAASTSLLVRQSLDGSGTTAADRDKRLATPARDPPPPRETPTRRQGDDEADRPRRPVVLGVHSEHNLRSQRATQGSQVQSTGGSLITTAPGGHEASRLSASANSGSSQAS